MSSYLFEDTKRPFDTLCRTFNTRATILFSATTILSAVFQPIK